jgi:mevalonate kinase
VARREDLSGKRSAQRAKASKDGWDGFAGPGPSVLGEAPGKVLLFGEHAVVYGQPAIGMPLSRGVKVELTPGRGKITIALPKGEKALAEKEAASPKALAAAVLGEDLARLDVRVTFEVVPMAGFGTSAAYALALLRAQDNLLNRTSKKLFERVMAVEALAHGRPSGVDPASCLANGPIHFVKRGERRTIRPLELGAPCWLVVAHAGTHGGAKKSISKLATWRDQRPELAKAIIEALGATTKAGAAALERGDLAGAGEAMDLAQGILIGLGLVSPQVREAVEQLKAKGALGAKMSGAGGRGGAYVGLFADAKRASAAARSLGGWLEQLQQTA